MKITTLAMIGFLAIGSATGYCDKVNLPKMNGKLKVTALASEEICYTGKPYSKELGAYVFNYRDYDPQINRWSTPDPSGFPNGANNHIYAPVPTRQIDFQGLFTVDPPTGIPVSSTTGSVLSFAYTSGGAPHQLFTLDLEAQSILQYSVALGYSGYIVQHVTFNNTVNGATNSVQPQLDYYEAWHVSYDSTNKTEVIEFGGQDTFTTQGFAYNGNGTTTITGHINFFQDSVFTGLTGNNDPANWSRTDITQTGGLLGTTTDPIYWWDDSGTYTHTLTLTWHE